MTRFSLTSLRSMLFLCMMGIGLLTALVYSYVLYRVQIEHNETALIETSDAVLRPIINLATRSVDGGNLMKLRNSDAQSLYEATGVQYLRIAGTSAGSPPTAFSAAVPPQAMEHEYMRAGMDQQQLRSLALDAQRTGIDREHWLYIARLDLPEVKNGGQIVAIFSSDILKGLVWRTLGQVALVSVAIFFIALAIVLLLGKRISGPVARMAVEMKDIADTLDLNMRATVAKTEEVGRTAIAFNALLAKFHEIIKQVDASMERLADSSLQMSQAATEANERIREQAAQTEQVVVAMGEMKGSSDEIAGNATVAAEAASNADTAATNGKRLVLQTSQMINTLAQGVDSASEVIRRLGGEAQNIGGVLNVIRGIAEQTNLLALNAAIEAARAGESGRGFAVVADEVRTLASRTQQSTEEIQRMIERLQGGSREAIQAMERGSEQAQSCVRQAETAASSLESIVAAVGSITDMNAQIAVSIDQQVTVAEEINRNLTRINELTEYSAQEVNNTARESSQLYSLSKQLKSLVDQFSL